MNPSSKYEIPDGEILFRFCKPSAFPDGQRDIPIGIFNDEEMSCDWQKYRSNPFESFHITEGRNWIIEICVCDEIRNPTNPKRVGKREPEWHQSIVHDPMSDEDDPIHGANIAHALIAGKKKIAVQEAIQRNAKWFSGVDTSNP